MGFGWAKERDVESDDYNNIPVVIGLMKNKFDICTTHLIE